jgi:hypothetical protein
MIIISVRPNPSNKKNRRRIIPIPAHAGIIRSVDSSREERVFRDFIHAAGRVK